MCAIAGILDLALKKIPHPTGALTCMNKLQKHRGPDGEGIWVHDAGFCGLAHRRLSIIDTTSAARQPMKSLSGNWITFNGEIYNYLELREQLAGDPFFSRSDTETILRSYEKWGLECVNHFRGMFAFAIWDEKRQSLVCARDRFGIKPFYYMVVDGRFYFASEIKALLPFVSKIETDVDGFKDYLTFQYTLQGKTMFKGIHELPPGYLLEIHKGQIVVRRYWEIFYEPDFQRDEKYFEEKIRTLLQETLKLHLRSDVPIGSYLSGGLDSSLISILASHGYPHELITFTGKFSYDPAYDESRYARDVAQKGGFPLLEHDINENDFVKNIEKVIYHLDMPTAGPGSFPQFMISQFASHHRKVLLTGLGGDEIFGGYTRYLMAYFEQCIRAAIDGTMHSGNFVVTYESIIPNLTALRSYKPMLQEFWREGLFEDPDKRYFRLIDRSKDTGEEIRWASLGDYSPYKAFSQIYSGTNIKKESYFDRMTHFDFKTLLPALLHVEDRMSMAHGVESRVPFLDHPLVEMAGTMPANVKFKNGTMKYVLKNAFTNELPSSVLNRTDKMGFPVPFQEWLLADGPVKSFVNDILSSDAAQHREFIDNKKVRENLREERRFGRKVWGLLCLELWQQTFHDRESYFKAQLKESMT